MADGAAPASAVVQTGRYAAFISYSHADEEFGDWLHRRLEGYQVPSALVGREGPGGPIKKRLGKVFRDRADLSAAHDLGAEIRQGLAQADSLIVLCSRRSCASTYVNDEIRMFKALGKGDRIFAAIVDGEPHAAGNPNYTTADECFPPALVYRIDEHGALTRAPEINEPIAADFRDGKDGRENGSLKLIAGLLGVGLDELVQRERQAERRRRLRANAIAAAMALLASGAAAGGVWAWVNEGRAQTALERAEYGEKRAREAQGQATLAAQLAEERQAVAEAERERALMSLAASYAQRADSSFEQGIYDRAMRLSLYAVVISGGRAPEAAGALSRAALLNQLSGRITFPAVTCSGSIDTQLTLPRIYGFGPDGASVFVDLPFQGVAVVDRANMSVRDMIGAARNACSTRDAWDVSAESGHVLYWRDADMTLSLWSSARRGEVSSRRFDRRPSFYFSDTAGAGVIELAGIRYTFSPGDLSALRVGPEGPDPAPTTTSRPQGERAGDAEDWSELGWDGWSWTMLDRAPAWEADARIVKSNANEQAATLFRDGRLALGASRAFMLRATSKYQFARRGEISTLHSGGFSSDGTAFATSNEFGEVHIWSTTPAAYLESETPPRTQQDEEPTTRVRSLQARYPSWRQTVTRSANGKFILLGLGDGQVILDETGAGERSARRHAGAVSGLAFSNDAARFSSFSEDGSWLVWDRQSLEPLAFVHLKNWEQRGYSPQFHPGGFVHIGHDAWRIPALGANARELLAEVCGGSRYALHPSLRTFSARDIVDDPVIAGIVARDPQARGDLCRMV